MINKVILVGVIGIEPQIFYSKTSKPFCHLTIGTTALKQEGEECTKIIEWHDVELSSRLAETIGEYGKRGQMAYLEGELKTRKWLDCQGMHKTATIIKAIRFLIIPQRPPQNFFSNRMDCEFAGNRMDVQKS